MEPSGRLAELVRRLDSLRAEPTLTNLAGALEDVKLTMADVADHVRETTASYHRSYVVRREHYELLVLTWLPGQGSAPHDHAGSIAAMQVLQGEALEGAWKVAPDGYVDSEYETPVSEGGLTAWQDAGVHTIRNDADSGRTLVTINVYAPPLRDFRRFVARPSSELEAPPSFAPGHTVVVVGGGFSGAMTAAQILKQASRAGGLVRVVLVERHGTIGEGLAYATKDLSHLLNVPAGRMSAWPDRPDDFVEWARERYGACEPSTFAPRRWYGEYVRETVLTTARSTQKSGTLSVVFDEVRRVARHPAGGWMVSFARTASTRASAVVLAIGHRPPPDPIGKLWSGPKTRFITDPWRAFATNQIRPEDPVIVFGSGLTAVDAVLSLSGSERRAPITLVSRRGLLPQPHASGPLQPIDLQSLVSNLLSSGVRAKDVLHELRTEARKLKVEGRDWRALIDGLRPHTTKLWAAMPKGERRKFLRHARPFWEVHRHRMAPAVAAKVQRLTEERLLRSVAGSVVAVRATDSSVHVDARERSSGRHVAVEAAWVVNCTGPAASNSAEANPVIGSLLVQGSVRKDDLALGLDADMSGAIIDAQGETSGSLFVVGTLRKPALWESTAVPELRGQAASVAERIVSVLVLPARR